MEKPNRIHIRNLGTDVLVSHGKTILDGLRDLGIGIYHSCGGNGTCTTCLIKVTKGAGKLRPRNEIEAEMAADRGFADEERLACQTVSADGIEIAILNLED